MDARDIFANIYATDEWRGGSGEGSTVAASAPYRRALEQILGARDVRSVTEVGCGDWQVSGLIDWQGVAYTGVDVVPELLEHNRAIAPAGFQFVEADARTAEPPAADLLVAKDVLQHWPIADIERFMVTNQRRYHYLLITNDISSVHCPPALQNSEIELGAWRTIDLEQPPFGWAAAWCRDYDVRGEWTKRILLYTGSRRRRLRSRGRRNALARARLLGVLS
jgi:SAM-dependent methyltransferase